MAIDAASIGTAFQQAYGSQPAQGDIDYWTQYGQGHGLDVDTLVYYLMKQTREPGGDQARRQLITQAYQERLHRGPSDQEVQWWGEQIMAHGPSGGDAAMGRDEPFTYVKLVQYIQDDKAQQAAQGNPPAGAPPAPQQGQPAQQHGGFKWPWQN